VLTQRIKAKETISLTRQHSTTNQLNKNTEYKLFKATTSRPKSHLATKAN
jgi:hypothetical protein